MGITSLRNALLNPIEEGNFYCLPNSQVFPVGANDDSNINPIPHKLLRRQFHKELVMIVQYLRENRIPNKGGVFFGPSGSGKSWAAMAVLMEELKASETTGRSVVFFEACSGNAFVFGKHRCVCIENMTNGPNCVHIPELRERYALLIYDGIVGGNSRQLCIFPCKYLVFSTPNAGHYKNLLRYGALSFICPSWTKQELKELEHGYGNRLSTDEMERRFDLYGGSPRSVVAFDPQSPDEQLYNVRRLLRGKIHLTSMSGRVVC